MQRSRQENRQQRKTAVLRGLALSAVLCTAVSFPALAGRWQKGSGRNTGKWWYNTQDGGYAKDGWYWIDGDEDGIAECYYFDADGWLVTQGTVDGYQLASDGAWMDSGVVVVKNVAGSTDVYTSGENEISTGTLELGSDMDLGTEIEFEDPTEETKSTDGRSDKSAVEAGTSPDSTAMVSGQSTASDNVGGTEVITVGSGPQASKTEDSSGGPGSSSGSKKKTVVQAYTGNVGSSAADLPKSDPTELIEYARSFIGVLPYVAAGTSLESGADCSGFTQQIFKHFGITIPRDSRSQYAASTKVSASELQPGDLIFYGSSPSTIYHVGIYSGNGTIIHCTKTGDYVREHNVFYSKPYGYGRYTK